MALSLLEGIGGKRYQELLERFGSAVRAFDAVAPADRREATLLDADRLAERALATGGTLVVRGDAAYPPALLDLADPPPHLFAIGDLAAAAPPSVAVVGTRSCSAYGERVAYEIAFALARAGATVVSGLARGIDSVAHRAALAAGGRTVAVLGTGVDVPYPAANAALHAEICARGLVLSEYPPGERATPGSFPRRNRVIAALAQVTIVVEAGAKSGALITAGHALDLGRTVAAVPGPIDSPRSVGTNELLRDGATVIASTADAVALLGLTAPPRRPDPGLDGDERMVWDALADGPMSMDALAGHAGLPARRCMMAVTALELAGCVECALTGEVRRR